MSGQIDEDLAAVDASVAIRIGAGLALVGEQTVALVDAANGGLAETLWNILVAGGGVDDLLEALSATGLRSLGNFALAQREPGAIRVVLRGTSTATIHGPTGDVILEASGVRTWLEEVVDNATGFRLALTGDADPALSSPFRVSAAILPADWLSWPCTPLAVGGLTNQDLGWVHDFVPPVITFSAPGNESANVASAPISAPVAGTHLGGAAGVGASVEPITPSVNQMVSPDASEVLEISHMPAAETMAPPGGAMEYDYDSLYGLTRAKSVQGAAMEFSADGELVSAGGMELINGIPSPTGGTELDHPRQGDHDGMTMSVAQLRALRAQGGVPASPSISAPAMGGPSVQALLCGSGHPNPPSLGACRVCRQTLGSTPVTIARPRLGRLTFTNGMIVDLDRPAIIGRIPKLEERMMSEIPQLIRIDVGQALSRSHVAIRLEGWQVLAEDLGSANGTIVTTLGQAPQRLRASEPVLLEHQARLDLGGEIVAVYDAFA